MPVSFTNITTLGGEVFTHKFLYELSEINLTVRLVDQDNNLLTLTSTMHILDPVAAVGSQMEYEDNIQNLHSMNQRSRITGLAQYPVEYNNPWTSPVLRNITYRIMPVIIIDERDRWDFVRVYISRKFENDHTISTALTHSTTDLELNYIHELTVVYNWKRRVGIRMVQVGGCTFHNRVRGIIIDGNTSRVVANFYTRNGLENINFVTDSDLRFSRLPRRVSIEIERQSNTQYHGYLWRTVNVIGSHSRHTGIRLGDIRALGAPHVNDSGGAGAVRPRSVLFESLVFRDATSFPIPAVGTIFNPIGLSHAFTIDTNTETVTLTNIVVQ